MGSKPEADLGQKILQLRKNAGLSQVQMAEELGLNRVSYTQLENGDRKVSADELGKIAKILKTTPDFLLGFKTEVEVTLESPHKTKPTNEMRINVPQKRVEKFKQVLLYVLGKVGYQPNVGETVVNKLLYFIDFDYYEKYEEQLMGATYIKNTYGPTVVELKAIVDDMLAREEIKREKVHYHDHLQTKFIPLKEPNLTLLTGQELVHIDQVLARLGHMGGREISDYSHKDVPWMTTPDGETINYEKAFYRQPPYSVRSYDGEDL